MNRYRNPSPTPDPLPSPRPRARALSAGRLWSTRRWPLLAALAGVVAVVFGVILLSWPAEDARSLSYSALIQAMDEGRVTSLVVRPGRDLRGTVVDAAVPTAAPAPFATVYPMDGAAALAARAAERGVDVRFEAPPLTSPARLAGTAVVLVLVVMLGTLLFLQVRAQGFAGAGEPAAPTGTTFQDVAGTQGAAEELREVVEFLRHPGVFDAMGARVPRGVLLIGPPGTGKTLLARAVAGEASVPFFHISGSEVTGFIVGLGAHRIRALFRRARRKGGVIFIDELDALGSARGRPGGHGEDDRTLNQLLVEMDGFSPADGVVVLGATNRPDDLDVALKRPGRFDRMVEVGLPTAGGREDILRLHVARRPIPLEPDVDLARVARLTPGASGAELANLLNEAAIAAVRDQAPAVAWRHVEQARDRLLLGKERLGFRINARESRVVAYHEAGHAIAGLVACPEDDLHKVTIQPRGRSLGVAHFAPESDLTLHSRRYLEAQIIKGLGGRAAEELVFGPAEVTGGAENDLVHVNRIARTMVFRLGMGKRSGLVVHDEGAGAPGPEQRAAADAEVAALLERLYARTREILQSRRGALEAVASALVERETLDGAEVRSLLQAHVSA